MSLAITFSDCCECVCRQAPDDAPHGLGQVARKLSAYGLPGSQHLRVDGPIRARNAQLDRGKKALPIARFLEVAAQQDCPQAKRIAAVGKPDAGISSRSLVEGGFQVGMGSEQISRTAPRDGRFPLASDCAWRWSYADRRGRF
jgi:hypothetical protein